ncbi:hypothetical protein TELCIR_17530, partial [Teladorsagia circumcincta]
MLSQAAKKNRLAECKKPLPADRERRLSDIAWTDEKTSWSKSRATLKPAATALLGNEKLYKTASKNQGPVPEV